MTVREEPRQATAFGGVTVHREVFEAKAAGMHDVISASRYRPARPMIVEIEDERRINRDRRM